MAKDDNNILNKSAIDMLGEIHGMVHNHGARIENIEIEMRDGKKRAIHENKEISGSVKDLEKKLTDQFTLFKKEEIDPMALILNTIQTQTNKMTWSAAGIIGFITITSTIVFAIVKVIGALKGVDIQS